MALNIDAARRWLDEHVEDMIALQRELTARPAISPLNGGEGEWAKGAFLQEYLAERGLPVLQRWDAPDARVEGGCRPNFVVGCPARRTSPAVWIMSHLDVVPPGEPDGRGGWKGWSGNPYVLRVEGDRLYGRGVEDNQKAIVCGVFAVLALRASGIEPELPPRLLFVSDEETQSRYGLQYVLETDRAAFSPDDLYIVPDAGNLDGTMIEVAEKSLLWLQFTVHGRQCHASVPHLGVNAFRVASRIVARIDEVTASLTARNALFDVPSTTIEPTRHASNVPNINTVPGVDVFCVDCRILPGESPDALLERLRALAAEMARDAGADVQVEIVARSDATEPTPPDSPVVRALSAAVREVLGVEPRPMGIGGGTVAAEFRRCGLPAAVWALWSDSAHQPDEFCPISQMVDGAKVFARILAGWE